MINNFIKTYKKYILIAIVILIIIIGYILYKNYRNSNKITELSINAPEFAEGVVGAYYSPDGIVIKYKVGSQIPIQITYLPSNTRDKKIEYILTNNNIINIDKSGILTAKTVGVTDIHIVSKNNKDIKSNTITIEVVE